MYRPCCFCWNDEDDVVVLQKLSALRKRSFRAVVPELNFAAGMTMRRTARQVCRDRFWPEAAKYLIFTNATSLDEVGQVCAPCAQNG